MTACRRHRLQPWPGNKSTGTPAPVAGTPRTARLEHDRVHQPADPTTQPSTRWPATTPNWICGINLAIMDAATEQLQEPGSRCGSNPLSAGLISELYERSRSMSTS